jgi:hypothetical protein
MKVQLAYDYEGHKADDVVNVEPESVARRLIAEGRARIPDGEEQPETPAVGPFGPGIEGAGGKVTKAKPATSETKS